MPDFDANDETRLPGSGPELPEETAEAAQPQAAPGAGLTGGVRRAGGRGHAARFARSLVSRRHARRRSCGRPAPAPLLAFRGRRAPCSRVRTTPPGHLR